MKDRRFLDETFASMFSNPTYREYLFYAHILGQCSVKLDKSLHAPAAVGFVTDHFELFINPEQFSQYPVNQRIGILKHEALHIINGHLGNRGKGLIPMIANIAMDTAINQQIKRSDLPEGCFYPDTLGKWLWIQNNQDKVPLIPENLKEPEKIAEWMQEQEANFDSIPVPENLTFEHYYNLIMENLPDNVKEEMKQGNGSGNPQDGEEQDSDSNGESQGQNKPAQHQKGKKGKFTPTEVDSHHKFGEGDISEDFIKERTKNILEKAKESTLMSNGYLPSNYSDMLALNSPKKSEIPWQKLFQNVQSNTKKDTRETYMRRSRRFPTRREIKGKLPNRTFEWLVISDVSGSMPDVSVKECLEEMIYLCKKMNTSARLIQVDVNAKPSEEINANIKKFERKASGGTLMYPGIEQADEEKLHYDAVIILTDGGLCNSDIKNFLKVKVPVIWIVTDDYNEDLERFRLGRMKAARLKVRG